ncbi:hypothetical protein [Methylomagnum ishizawai]|nr:hypothetical protein [Methylomagnum ishizawai]
MYEWHVRFSKTEKIGSQLSCEVNEATVLAADEEEVRQIMAEERPGWDINEIKRGESIDDDA